MGLAALAWSWGARRQGLGVSVRGWEVGKPDGPVCAILEEVAREEQ